MLYPVIAGSALGAGLIQSVTGFGGGIFMMLFFPLLLPILKASAVSSAIAVVFNGAVAVRFRKHINYKSTLVPALFYVMASSTVIYFAPYMPKEIILKIFGVFLIALAIYFLFFPDKIKVTASVKTASVCALLSGCASGLFGIGGPPMVVYFLAATKEKEEYLGTIQFFFFISNFYNLIFRIVRGIYTIDLVPLTFVGVAAILIGEQIGARIVNRINVDMMKKLVYIFLAISGVLNLI